MLIARELLDEKQRRFYTVNFPWLATDEKIVLLSHEIEADDSIFSIDQLVIDTNGTEVHMLAIAGDVGGNDGEEYVVKLFTTTNLGQVNADCIRFLVSCGSCC